MKRLHIHVGVDNLDSSIQFYNALFGADPVKTKPDYAKWMLEDPRINFAISTRSGKTGVDHLGIQVDNLSELEAIRSQMSAANISTHSDGETTCCYAKSEKSWIEDPDGIAWEAYQTMEDVQLFAGSDIVEGSACCAPQAKEEEKSTSCCG
tara:strand:- start:16429 stop:16881 length:453 start_codon:yes stop_codon:yes gene_type:complete